MKIKQTKKSTKIQRQMKPNKTHFFGSFAEEIKIELNSLSRTFKISTPFYKWCIRNNWCKWLGKKSLSWEGVPSESENGSKFRKRKKATKLASCAGVVVYLNKIFKGKTQKQTFNKKVNIFVLFFIIFSVQQQNVFF